jgi:hypothetical protein
LFDFVTELFKGITVAYPPQLYLIPSKILLVPSTNQDISGNNFPDMRLNDKNITDMSKKLIEICKKEKMYYLTSLCSLWSRKNKNHF